LALLSKVKVGGTDCQFTVKFCIRKKTSGLHHIDYAAYHTGGRVTKTVYLSGVAIDSVICDVFSFTAHCNSTASFVAVGKQSNNTICGTVSDLIILPIRLLSFTGELQKNGVIKLNWQTADESNSSHFIIQQTIDGAAFSDIAKVQAAGESKDLKAYTIDLKPNTTSASVTAGYYRLKMVDKDGSFIYSEIIKIGSPKTRKFDVFPNPTTHILHFDFSDLQREELKILNLQGQELSIKWLDENTLDLYDLNPGFYILKYEDEIIRVIKE